MLGVPFLASGLIIFFLLGARAMAAPDAVPPIIVVGGGLAGLSAAAEIAGRGGSVVVLEKIDRLGGNSAKASSGMNAAGSGPQAEAGIQDNPQLFTDDTLRSGKGRSSVELVGVVARNSASAISFLQGFGVNLSAIEQCGGHSKPRTHRAAPDGKPMNIGFRIMSALIAHLNALQAKGPQKVSIRVNSRAVELLTEPAPEGGDRARVVGVRIERPGEGEGSSPVQEEVLGSAVVLTTGGYSADKEGLLKEHAPCLKELPTTNGPFATGDGVRLGAAVGAELVQMDQVQVHPTGLVDPKDPSSPVKILGPETLRGSGGVLLNHKGQRFVNELSTRDKVVSGMLQNCQPLNASESDPNAKPCTLYADGAPAADVGPECCPVPSVVSHLILTEDAVQRFGEAPAKFYLFKGLLRKFASLDELSQELHLPPAQVRATLEAYDAAAAGAAEDPFGKTVFPSRFSAVLAPPSEGAPPVYAALVTPVLHYCMGGLGFDAEGRVMGARGAIPGLYAAGEVTGGLHGANRLAGNSLLECVVFGRIAASTAWAEAAKGAGGRAGREEL